MENPKNLNLGILIVDLSDVEASDADSCNKLIMVHSSDKEPYFTFIDMSRLVTRFNFGKSR